MNRNKTQRTETARADRRRGSTLVECALAGTFIFLPLLAGTVTVGLSTLRALEVNALTRSAGHMFSTGVDFSQASNRNLILKMAGDLNITDSGGDGVIILSEIDGTGTNTAVCARRITIGNAALSGSRYTNPSSDLVDSSGNVTDLNSPSADATGVAGLMPLAQGDVVYLAEAYFTTSDYDWVGVLSTGGIYKRIIF